MNSCSVHGTRPQRTKHRATGPESELSMSIFTDKPNDTVITKPPCEDCEYFHPQRVDSVIKLCWAPEMMNGFSCCKPKPGTHPIVKVYPE